ncbi:YrhC family protein [Virgibacillus flavescens]|uniref:YrhC family protein n=1 Tax=Virgibacillus flavescens TaxID=1611422 RepID=UPI003D332948
MGSEQKYLEKKQKDYHTFIHTLFILSIYFYLGIVIDIYGIPNTDHTVFLSFLSIISLSAIAFFVFRYKKIRQKIDEGNQT